MLCRPCSILLLIFLLPFAREAAQPVTLHTGENYSAKPPVVGRFTQIGLDQGLSQSTVYAITQDAQGFMWFGTQEGLNRYDGYSIKVFKHTTDPNSLSDNSTLCLLSDSRGDLWIGTIFGGLERYVIAENKFYHHKHSDSDKNSLSDNRVNVLYEDPKGNIWAGTPKGLDLYDRKTDSFIHYYSNNTDSQIIEGVNAICADKDNILWIGSMNGLFSINLNNPGNSLSKIPSSDDITSLFVDNSNILWVGSVNHTLQSYNKNGKNFKYYENTFKGTRPLIQDLNGNLWMGSLYSPGIKIINAGNGSVSSASNLPNDVIDALFEDNSGIIWIGTSLHGVFKNDTRNNRFGYYLNDSQNPDIVTAILEDKGKHLWVGTLGNGLKYFNDQRDQIITFLNDTKNTGSIGSNRVIALAEASDDNIWIGMLGGLDLYNKSTGKFKHYKKRTSPAGGGLSGADVTALYDDKKGNLLVGYYSGEIDRYKYSDNSFTSIYSDKDKQNINAATIIAFGEDSKGIIWIGTHGSGLISYNPVTENFKKYRILLPDQEKYINPENIDEISTIYIESDTVLWLGSSRSGLIRFNPVDGSSKFYAIDEGMPDNVTYGVLGDNSGNIWISTNNGISRFNPVTGAFKNFDKNDGLQANEFNQGAYYKNSEGELFFGGVNGFNSFFPDRIKDNETIPPVYLTSFKVFDKAIPLKKSITDTKMIELSYFQNFFSFEFVSLSYTAPGKNQYAYKLEGFDKDWHYVPASNRYASYTNLDPGEYVLRVKGSNNDGRWNEKGASVKLIITPPFWMTWWFRAFIIFIFVSLGPVIYSRRVNTLKKEKALQLEISRKLIERQEEERSRIAQEMHDSIGQDMLFIKNRALLTMKKAAHDPQICNQLDQISEASSKSLKTVREISHNLRPPELDRLGLTETIRTLLLQARDSTTLKVEGEVEEIDGLIKREMEINIIRVIQEALGNTIRHAAASEFCVFITRNDGHINLDIYDNGRGFEVNNSNPGSIGLGLTGMKERVRILNGTISINSESGKGTKIRITIPSEAGRINGA